MKATLSKKQTFFNQINLTEDDDLYIGIDVHKLNYHVALHLNGTHAIDYITPADNAKLCKSFKKLAPAIKNIVYEAGPTGYSLARQLQQHSLPIQVIAPSKTPQCSARDSKTDRLDGRKLAAYAAKNLLRPIAIPTRDQEATRQRPRLRTHFVYKLKQTKLQIKSFLLQHGIAHLARADSRIAGARHVAGSMSCLVRRVDGILDGRGFLGGLDQGPTTRSFRASHEDGGSTQVGGAHHLPELSVAQFDRAVGRKG